MTSTASTITICRLSGGNVQLEFDPAEPTWSFSRRFGEKIPGALHDGTNSWGILFNGREINTFENRLKPIGSLIPEHTSKVHAILWDLRIGSGLIWKGNASPRGGERETCAICLDEMHDIHSGPFDGNSLIAVALKCGHAFHKGCFAEYRRTPGGDTCPTCRAPIRF